MMDRIAHYRVTASRDLVAGLVVFLVALPLCLGIALASNAPLISGLISGIVGGIVVGSLSGSHTSVSGPAAGLTAIVASEIAGLGAFETFLFAVVVAGGIQILLGIAKSGSLSAFVPSSVISGLLAAIGVILILKQLPHVMGRDVDPEGEMSFEQPDHETTFSEFGEIWHDIHWGAATIGIGALIVLIVWDRWKVLKSLPIPSPLVVVVLGVIAQLAMRSWGTPWTIEATHLVSVPVAETWDGFRHFLRFPNFGAWNNLDVYRAALTMALVASLETLLNLEAIDKLDPQKRNSNSNRELIVQGIGNMLCGLIGGIPLTSVIVRSSVNIHAGAQTKLSAVVHGLLLGICVVFLPKYVNMIPLSCLAAILLVTGFKLAHPHVFVRMWQQGRYQFVPFILTLVAIVFTDLLIGVLIGLGVSVAFILNSHLRRPMQCVVEKHLAGNVMRIELANQVSFLNRASLQHVMESAPRGTHLLLDAHSSDFIDPDILSLIREFKNEIAEVRGVQLSLVGFRDKYHVDDQILFVDHSTRELQRSLTGKQVLQILQQGNERFRSGKRLHRDFGRQVFSLASGQNPLAVVLSCIDSRTPAEYIFDMGLGDIFSIRIAGNVVGPKVLGSIEYSCAVAGARLILVVGHTRCGAVTASVELLRSSQSIEQATGCQHLDAIVNRINRVFETGGASLPTNQTGAELLNAIDEIARKNVLQTVRQITTESASIAALVRDQRVVIAGAMYDISTGRVELVTELPADVSGVSPM